MRGDSKSLLLNNSLMVAVRIALGISLVVIALMIVGSTRASAATEPLPATQLSFSPDSANGSGLPSGILGPVENVVDQTVNQLPVVEAMPILDPVTAPVSTAAIPIVTAVIALPVIVPPVIEAVDAVTAPVLEIVDQVVEPVVQIVAPTVDPVAAVEHVVPALPELPGAGPVIPVVPRVVTPDIPAVSGEALEAPNFPATPESHASATSAVQPGPETAAQSPVIVAHRILADSLAAAEMIPEGFWAVDVPAQSGAGSPGSGTQSAACGSMAGQTVGPCAPAVASTVGLAPSGAGSGGSGGSSGTAANENFSTSLNFEAGWTAISNAGWPLPASMPSDPGSSPG